MKYVIVIPARYASTRFPGKPLAMLGGKSIIQRVYERVCHLANLTVVATDDQRIFSAVESFGGHAVMTRQDHHSGTDRCWEAVEKLGADRFDVVINVQGDEPFVHPSQIEALKACFDDEKTQIATLVKPYDADAPLNALENPNSPKVVIGAGGQALYFSRSVIPYLRGVGKSEWLKKHTYYKHLGLYAYLTPVLHKLTLLPQGELEKAESLEQLRWLENGYHIKVGQTQLETVGIDTPDDLRRAEQFLNEGGDKI